MKQNELIDWGYIENPEDIPWPKVVCITDADGPTVNYGVPSSVWQEHLHGWIKARSNGNKTAPQPFPEGHCMFENPEQYSCVAWGDTSDASKRKAWENQIRGDLHGWDRFLFDAMPQAEAQEKLDAIVNTTVEAKMRGVETNAWHFMTIIAEGALA